MDTHIEKLVIRYFEALVGPDTFKVGFGSGQAKNGTPLALLHFSCGLRIIIDESDCRPSHKRRCYTPIESMLIVRQPQELLKKETTTWLESVTGYKFNPTRLPHALKEKIKAYKKNYSRSSSRKRMRIARRKSQQQQIKERKHQEHRQAIKEQIRQDRTDTNPKKD
ncbi:hypothetical protein HY733_00765 [Candidatus Uhrbacteria bacterium]|nr:hypothetical protein [Candidatus Uhrbacteria bacterium]